jgi:hypothetical protein
MKSMVEERNDVAAHMTLVSTLDVYESCDPPLPHSLPPSIFQSSTKSLKSAQMARTKYVSECLMAND